MDKKQKKIKMKTILIILLLFLWLFSSCGGAIECNESEIVGKYEARHGKGTEYIDLRQGGIYIHSFKNDSIEIADTAKWRIDSHDGCTVDLYDFRWYLPEAEKEWGWLHGEIGDKKWTKFTIPRYPGRFGKRLMISFDTNNTYGTFYKIE